MAKNALLEMIRAVMGCNGLSLFMASAIWYVNTALDDQLNLD